MPKLKLPKTTTDWLELLSQVKTVAIAIKDFFWWGRGKGYWDKKQGPTGMGGGMHGPGR